MVSLLYLDSRSVRSGVRDTSFVIDEVCGEFVLIILRMFRMPDEIPTMDFNDTFLDIDHLRNSFPGYKIRVKDDENDDTKMVRPFRLTFEDVLNKDKDEPKKKMIMVEPHVPPSRGPYKANQPKKYISLMIFVCHWLIFFSMLEQLI